LVAALHALLSLNEKGSLRACSMALIVCDVGQEGDPPCKSEDHPGLIKTNWLETTKRGARAATIEGRAVTLRKKYRCNRSSEEANWLFMMGKCFQIVFKAVGQEGAKARILELAASVGEGKYAQEVLWRMLDGESASPDFRDTLGTTTAQ
jgi:hypothetical protein